jgi:hypothetical protein
MDSKEPMVGKARLEKAWAVESMRKLIALAQIMIDSVRDMK